MNQDYYQKNFLEYHEQTFHVNPDSFLEPLARHLKPGARVLDVGCGSGRDLLWFKNRGFAVSGLERSAGLARLARENAGCEVLEGDFEQVDFSGFQVDAVVLIGALAHVPHDQMAQILRSIVHALQGSGHVLITLKKGEGMTTLPDGRAFYLWSQSALAEIFDRLELIAVDFSQQVSKVRPDDVWLGYVLRQLS